MKLLTLGIISDEAIYGNVVEDMYSTLSIVVDYDEMNTKDILSKIVSMKPEIVRLKKVKLINMEDLK